MSCAADTETAAFTRDEAQAANAELRAEMRASGNYFNEIEGLAADAVEATGYQGAGAMSKGDINALAAHFGFTVIRAHDVPATVRSVTDMANRRIYVPGRDDFDPARVRSVVLQTLGHFALDHGDPADFADFLRQRVETNYFAGAVLIPATTAVPFLKQAKEQRNLSVEDLMDHFYVSYEMAGHRFTNLATEHLDLETHFVRSDELGIIWKAYENDDVPFPQNWVGAPSKGSDYAGNGVPAGRSHQTRVMRSTTNTPTPRLGHTGAPPSSRTTPDHLWRSLPGCGLRTPSGSEGGTPSVILFLSVPTVPVAHRRRPTSNVGKDGCGHRSARTATCWRRYLSRPSPALIRRKSTTSWIAMRRK